MPHRRTASTKQEFRIEIGQVYYGKAHALQNLAFTPPSQSTVETLCEHWTSIANARYVVKATLETATCTSKHISAPWCSFNGGRSKGLLIHRGYPGNRRSRRGASGFGAILLWRRSRDQMPRCKAQIKTPHYRRTSEAKCPY